MEKVNVMFHDNGTVTYQHNKILKFVPELSVGNKNEKLTVPNIPLLVSFIVFFIKIDDYFLGQTLTTKSSALPRLVQAGMSLVLRTMDMKPFVTVTPEELVFGYDDTLTNLANKFFPKNKRPHKKMGLLLGVCFF